MEAAAGSGMLIWIDEFSGRGQQRFSGKGWLVWEKNWRIPHLGGLLEVELLPCAEDVVHKPVEGEARGNVEGEPACGGGGRMGGIGLYLN